MKGGNQTKMPMKLGKYVHFEGNEYIITGVAKNNETLAEMIIYHKADTEDDIWVCSSDFWNDVVEYNNGKVKRFIHTDDIVKLNITTEPPTGIHKRSEASEKIELFLSLFTGRDDVFAKRYENTKKGISGYVPACYSEWSPLCPKTNGQKMKCSDCPSQKFIPFDANAVEKHLTGKLTIGSYAMLSDETCRFLVFDFDGKEYSDDDIKRDISAIRDVCVEKDINMSVERSRSGKGYHFWIFFSENLPASVARKFGSSLITYTMNKTHKLTLKTYDRLLPNQDTLPKGGFGNLIALPLQKTPREQGNSVFVDENFNIYADQWNYLFGVKKYAQEEIEKFIRQLTANGTTSELGNLRLDSETEDEKPWENQKTERKAQKLDFPKNIKIVRANMLYIEKAGMPSPALNALKRLAAFSNPEFYKTQAMRLSTHDKPRIISCSNETEQYMCLPRGLENDVCSLLKNNGVDAVNITIEDATNSGRAINVTFNGALRGEQPQAADALISCKNGVLSATTAFGKTVIGAYLIAERKVNTLILVHRTNLMTQWVDKLSQFLTIDEEAPIYETPTGRKKKMSLIGQIGGGKNAQGGIVDVAIMQSLISKDEVKELVKDYGMVIVDECHHVSAFSFEQILKNVNAKYVYGLTATPTRKEGHHPIIFMHCGKIRYRVDAKKQAEERPFDHFIIPRFTRFQKPAHKDKDKWNIVDIYNDIQNNTFRNDLIVQDVITAVNQGRNPIILSERTEHVRILTEMLNPHIKNVIALTGGTSQKQSRETLQNVADIPLDEPFVLVATGKYVGEGFDMPRLDTLFLAMPISWKGTLQQYAGRLHRLYDGKKEVQIYDYVDVYIEMLERMYQNRLKGYASIGYKAKGNTVPIEEVHSIFDSTNFSAVYKADILASQNEVLIVSPFLTKRRILHELPNLTTVKTKVTVFTRPLNDYKEKDRERISECLDLLAQHNITVKTKERIHQKFAVMDGRVVWYGSINLLSFGVNSEESIMRIDSPDIANELMRGL